MVKTIAVLGATGSIGTQTLDMIRRYPDLYHASCLTAASSRDKLFELVREFRPEVAGLVADPGEIPSDLSFCTFFTGPDCSVQCLKAVKPDAALCAITGIAGLDTVLTALEECKQVLLANKEALVTGGNLVTEKAAKNRIPLLPVDSEHSAIFQCLQAAGSNPVRTIHLTCSGGALRSWDAERIQNARISDVLAHPTWRMGSKITVDCASLVNKGLEVIEAHHLFGKSADEIHVVIHPESIIHSMVEFEDGAVLAQLGNPDMRGPIGYAMSWPKRLPYDAKPLNFAELGCLHFAEPDLKRFPSLGYAYDALRRGGNAPVVLNGANEAAVEAFLKGEIRFGRIPEIICDALNAVPFSPVSCIGDVYEADRLAREHARKLIQIGGTNG